MRFPPLLYTIFFLSFLILMYCNVAQAQRNKLSSGNHGIDITISRVVPFLQEPPPQNFLFHESITYSFVAGENFRIFVGINFLAPAKDGITRYGFNSGFLAGSKNYRYGIIYGPTLFHIVSKTAYENGALRNYHNTGLAFNVGAYYVPFNHIVLSTKIAPALYIYNFKKVNNIPVIANNADTRSQTIYGGFYHFLSFSFGYRF